MSVTYDLVVVGLGYVGLPLALAASRGGLSVAGYDVNADVVAGLGAGRSHVDDLGAADIAELYDGGFTATTDADVLADGETVIVCVPTPLGTDGGPDLSAVLAAMTVLARHLRRGALVVLESTTFPGTTENVVLPLLRSESGFSVGSDFCLAFSPERVDPGNRRFGIRNTPKVVGGVTATCTARAEEFYARFVDTVVAAKGTREAETAKLLENTYRHVNIALVNEMARFCHELSIDLWDVIRLASTKPFGFEAFYPGPGVGGHCIPIDPNYLSHAVRSTLGYPFRFVELAQEINATMPAYVARRAQNILNDDGLAIKGSSVLLLGVTYKANIADQRGSPAVDLARHLADLGAELWYHDPHVPIWEAVPAARSVESVDGLDAALSSADLVILVQHHREYDVDALAQRARRLFDTRGASTVAAAVRL